MSRTCPRCQGEGRVIPKPCNECRGQGLVRQVRQIKVRIPKGVDTGAKIQMRGEGEAGVNGGPPGDLFVMIHVAPHELFVRENYDLVTSVNISFPQAALGTTIEIPTIDGTTKITVPSGTQFGTRLRIPHKGIPYYNHYGSGDLIVEIQVETPMNLTEREKEILEAFIQARGEGEIEEHSGFFDKIGDKFFHRHDDHNENKKE